MRRKTPTRYRQHNPVFKNLIHCTSCGGLVTWQLQKGRYYGACQRKRQSAKAENYWRGRNRRRGGTYVAEPSLSFSEVIEWVAEAMRGNTMPLLKITLN